MNVSIARGSAGGARQSKVMPRAAVICGQLGR